jgi:hypothetical protein
VVEKSKFGAVLKRIHSHNAEAKAETRSLQHSSSLLYALYSYKFSFILTTNNEDTVSRIAGAMITKSRVAPKGLSLDGPRGFRG